MRRAALMAHYLSSVLLLSLAHVAPAQVSTPPSAGRPPTDARSLPPLTVEGHPLEKRTWRFVVDVTAASGFFMDEAVQQWRRPLCPLVAGLPPSQGQFVFDHLQAELASIGVPRGLAGCHPNFFVIVTDDPDSVLKGAWKRNYRLFGDASSASVAKFIRTPRPIRVWYNNILASADGPAIGAASIPALASDPNFAQSAFAGVPSLQSDGNQLRAEFTALHDLLAVIAIVDPSMLAGFTWTQVTDYVVMVGLTRISPDVDVADAPSILRLFSAAPDARPTQLSDWDRSFLKDLYGTDPVRRDQRREVSLRMVRDLSTHLLPEDGHD